MRSRYLISLALLPLLAQAGDNTGSYYGKKEEGWFWYKDPKMVQPRPPVAVAPSPVTKPPAPRPFTVKWLREHMDNIRESAIDNPTNPDGSPSKEMVLYMYLQRVVLDKSQNFANAAEQVVQSDPLLDENNRIPFGSAARSLFMDNLTTNKDAALKLVSQKAGLWFFFDSKCAFCTSQLDVLQRFASHYGFVTRNISLDGKPLPGMTQWLPDQGQSKLLKLKLSPTVVLVQPPNNFYIISQGMSSEETLGKKVMLVAATQKMLPESTLQQVKPFERGVLANKDLQGEQLESIEKDPAALVKYLQDNLGHEYQ